MDVASPRCSLSEIPEGGIPLSGEDGAFAPQFTTSKGKFWKRENCKIQRGNCNFGPNPGQMAFLEGSKGQNERSEGPKGQNERK